MSNRTHKVESISGFSNKYQVFYVEEVSNEVMFNENLAVSVVEPTKKVEKVANKGYTYQTE